MSGNPANPSGPGRVTLELIPTAGTLVGNRFEVGEQLAIDALGVVVAARDTKTDKSIFLRVLRPELVTEDASRALRADARIAAELRHKSILAMYGVGTTPAGTTYAATEAIDGVPLSSIIAQRKAQGGHISLRGAFNVVAHVCKALAHAQDRMCHGTLRPSIVWIGKSGGVKVGDFGVGRVLVAKHGAAVLGNTEQACLAPEVKAGGTPDTRSDIFGLGAILYELLTGKSPADGFVPPSQAHPDATTDVDHVLLRCLAATPEGRFGSADEVRTALLPLVGNAPKVSAHEDFGLDTEVEVDLDLGMVAAPTDPAIDAARASRTSGDRPKVGQRVAAGESFRASLVDAPPATGELRASAVDLSGALSKLGEKDSTRFMLQRDGLDYGPFSGREVIEQIGRGEIRGEHRLLNTDTGEKRLVSEWPDFADVAARWLKEHETAQHKASVVSAAAADTKGARTKLYAGLGALAVALAAGGYFLVTRQAAQEQVAHDQEVTSLYDIGRIQASASGDVLDDPGRHASAARRAAGGGTHTTGAGSTGGTGGQPEAANPGVAAPAPEHGSGHGHSFEDAMNQVVDFGDISQGGAMTQLTGPQVAEVMNQHVGRIYGACVPAEQARGGTLGRVQIDVAIAGDGHVLGASSRQGSPEFKSCIGRQVSSVHFPSFGAPRMAARYSFDAS